MSASSRTSRAGFRAQDRPLWRRLSARYEWLVTRLVPQADAFFGTCLSFIPNGALVVLELGSGTGFATERLLQRNPEARVTCLDFSPEMLAAARAKSSLARVRFVQADIRGQWPQERFDVVFTTLCLHHLTRSERREAISKCYKALRRHGRLINGDIFKPATRWEERLWRERWLTDLRKNGLSASEAKEMLAKRQSNMPCFDTMDEHRAGLAGAGFPRVLSPWVCEMAAVFVGFRC